MKNFCFEEYSKDNFINIIKEEFYKKYEDEELYKRITKEIEILERKNQLMIIYLLYKYKKQKKYKYHFRGMINNLFLMYVLNLTIVNPLNEHYYCKKCKLVNEKNTCKKCNKKLKIDGYSLPYQLYTDEVISVDVLIDCNLSLAYDFANDYMEDFGFVKASFKKDKDEVINELMDNHYMIIPKYDSDILLRYNEFGILETYKTYENYKGLYSTIVINDKWYYIGKKVTYKNIVSNKVEKDLENLLKPSTMKDYVKIKSLAHGSFIWNENQEKMDEINITNIISNREDVIDYLLEHNISENIAFEILNLIRNNYKEKNVNKWEKYIKIMKDHNCEESFIETVTKVKFLFGRGQAVSECLWALDKNCFITEEEYEKILENIK